MTDEHTEFLHHRGLRSEPPNVRTLAAFLAELTDLMNKYGFVPVVSAEIDRSRSGLPVRCVVHVPK
ncbi:hypothetical protein [Streptomyces phytophilus]|uniref:hypothetical protein n=1 Tax=Streptomyces phytophilus TaxID=722715 RepID=UPI0015F0FB17|nr:hypothetical protein [Streptomyces phytophilus]